MMQTEKVPIVRSIKQSVEIGWDGGANLENTHIITHAGVNIINVGSAIAKADDPAQAFNDLNTATENEDAL